MATDEDKDHIHDDLVLTQLMCYLEWGLYTYMLHIQGVHELTQAETVLMQGKSVPQLAPMCTMVHAGLCRNRASCGGRHRCVNSATSWNVVKP